MERVPRGEQADPVQTSRHYFKSCCGDSFRKRRLLCRRRQNWWVHGRLVERSSGFVVFYYKSLCLKTSEGFCLLLRGQFAPLQNR